MVMTDSTCLPGTWSTSAEVIVFICMGMLNAGEPAKILVADTNVHVFLLALAADCHTR